MATPGDAKAAEDPNVVEAEPTKDLFIHILTKDIPLIRAILDLVDNCVDGARRVRDNDYAGLWIRIDTNPESFKIADNCGGIPIDVARRYAFRFGRPADMPATPKSVGQFGVGMKRALFKIGNHFHIESRTRNERFVVEVDVPTWRVEGGPWHFRFQELQEGLPDLPEEERGTTLTVTNLLEQVRAEFGLEAFSIRLGDEVSAAHQLTIEKGIAITLNGIPLAFQPRRLLQTDELKPAYKHLVFQADGRPTVNVRVYCGLSESVPKDAGWNVFCNGRLLLKADQTIITGWGEDNEESIPKYHNQYARFRGYAYFDSDDAGLLPWNTTKTGVDVDSPTYIAARQQMIVLMRPVVDFINRVKDMPDVTLDDMLNEATQVAAPDIVAESAFSAPPPALMKRPRTVTIQYSKPVQQIDRAMQALGVSSARQVGVKTFEYYYKLECED